MTPVRRIEHRYSNGKFYSPFGVPSGVTSTDETREYWALADKDGITYGVQHATEQAAQAHHDAYGAGQDAEFTLALRGMTDKRLAEQAAFWLPALATT